MINVEITIGSGDLDRAKGVSIQRIQGAMLYASDKAAGNVLRKIRASGAIGKFGNVLQKTSDKDKGQVFKRGGGKFSASGVISLRKKGERTEGALESLTQPRTDILPKKTPWLWFPTAELGIKRIRGKKPTPALYRAAGFTSRIGPLIQISGSSPNEALLIVRNVQVRQVGRGRPLRGSRTGVPRAGRENKEFIVAFIGIKKTTRTQKINVPQIVRNEVDNISTYLSERL